MASFVVGSGCGLKTMQTAAEVPKKVKKTCSDNLGFKKNDIPSNEFARFLENYQSGVLKMLLMASLIVLGSLGLLLRVSGTLLGVSWRSFGLFLALSWVSLG